MKKALIFNPYLDTLGGGERYSFTFALGLLRNGFEVDIAWPENNILQQASARFGLDFSSLRVNPEAFDRCKCKTTLVDRYLFTKEYDLVFWVSDGSIPFLFSKNNLVHFQVPFKELAENTFVKNLKSHYINKFVYNSDFTKAVHEKHFDKKKSFVLYPPIDTDSFVAGQKENLILSVARFGSPLHSKRQDILIEAFRKLSSVTQEYKLVLAGGIMGDTQILDDLRELAKGLNFAIIPSPHFDELKDLYSRAKFFWHAAGFEIDEEKYPEKVEHFGMTTVEAMASGCVPLVIARGGQKEIITADAGILCADDNEIAQKTYELISNPVQAQTFSDRAVARSKDFSISRFFEKINQLVS